MNERLEKLTRRSKEDFANNGHEFLASPVAQRHTCSNVCEQTHKADPPTLIATTAKFLFGAIRMLPVDRPMLSGFLRMLCRHGL